MQKHIRSVLQERTQRCHEVIFTIELFGIGIIFLFKASYEK